MYNRASHNHIGKIHMKRLSLYLLLVFYSFTLYASPDACGSSSESVEEWIQSLNKNVRAYKGSVKNVREHITEQTYKMGLKYMHQEILLLKKIKDMTHTELAKKIYNIARIAVKFPYMDEIDVNEVLAYVEKFSSIKEMDSLKDYLKAGADVCNNTEEYSWLGDLVGHKEYLENQDEYLASVLPYCYAITYLSLEKFQSKFFRKGPLFVFDTAFTGLPDREEALKEYFGVREYKNFLFKLEEVRFNDVEWSYPNVVAYIPSLKQKSKDLLLDFSKALLEKIQNEDSYDAASFAHQEWVHMHLLADGNGRVGRLLMNLVLMDAGLAPVFIDDDREYTNAVTKDLEEGKHFVDFIRSHQLSSQKF